MPNKRFEPPAALVGVIALVLPGPATAQPTRPAPVAPVPAPPASLAGFRDDGVFLVYKNEERIVTIRFKWLEDGTFENERTLMLGGQEASSKLSIRPATDGAWTNISLETPLGPVSVVRDGARCRVTQDERIEELLLKPGVVLFENFAPALMSQAVRMYDTKRGGKQQFPLFILPRRLLEVSLESLGPVDRTVGGRDVRFERYRYAVPGVDVILWTDAEGKLYFANVPEQNAAYVREGYEILLRTPESDPLLSNPEHAVKVERNVGVPMSDGVKLATDIYRPDTPGPVPVIVVRTPYKKEMLELRARYFARRGYAFAVQDCRGRFQSPGRWEPLRHAASDGSDTVEWLAARPWSTGRVGMMGAGYQARATWLAAGRRPPHLVTIIPSVTGGDPFYGVPYDHGILVLRRVLWWIDLLETEATGDLSGAGFRRLDQKNYHELLRALPVVDLDESVLGTQNAYWREWIAHPAGDTYWQQVSLLDRLEKVNLPVFHQSGWFDSEGLATKLNYLRMASHGHAHQKLVLGPWGHTSVARRRIADRDFGPEAVIDLERAYLRWFDRWLKGVENRIEDEPLVSLFVIGSNRWLHGDTYPLPETRYEKWYLSSRGRANTSRGDGWLTRRAPRPRSRIDRYTYDPGDPTPDPTSYPEQDDETTADGKKVRSQAERRKAREAYHQEVTRARRDILVYQTAKFRRPYTILGPMTAVLYASSSARDTDWFVRLVEVDAEDRLLTLAEGKVRARFRQSMSRPELLEPGKIYEYHIDLRHTGITIQPEHRLRVEIASASFPSYSRNLNTGGHNETGTEHIRAEQRVYHDAGRPSHILLPVVSLPPENSVSTNAPATRTERRP